MEQYDSKSKVYSDFVEFDPCKRFVQYPEAIRLLGNLKNKRVLDVGCGSGFLTREIAQSGAKVVAYDVSEKQIELAIKVGGQNIKYLVADPVNIEKKLGDSSLFDKAISNLVLHYAKDKNHLIKFFSSTFNLLKEKGVFVAIFTNPNYNKLGKKIYNRYFEETKSGMKADFLDNSGKTLMTIYFSNFTKKDYEDAAKKAGFKYIKWEKIRVSKQGIKELGKYWKDFENDCPYVGLICKKT